jgi:hypothetical protein
MNFHLSLYSITSSRTLQSRVIGIPLCVRRSIRCGIKGLQYISIFQHHGSDTYLGIILVHGRLLLCALVKVGVSNPALSKRDRLDDQPVYAIVLCWTYLDGVGFVCDERLGSLRSQSAVGYKVGFLAMVRSVTRRLENRPTYIKGPYSLTTSCSHPWGLPSWFASPYAL